MTVRLGTCLLVAVALLGACSDDSDGAADDVEAPSAVPEGPAECAGAVRDGLEEGHQYEWDAARAELLAADPSPVWLGFSRVLSIEEARDELGPLEAHGVQLVYEQHQGTYAKVHQRLDPVALDDPEFGAAAGLVLATALGPQNAPVIGPPDAFDPVDEAVQDGQPPISGLLLSGDVAAVFAHDTCLVHSMTVEASPTGPPISPAIEPDPNPVLLGP